MKRSVTGTDTLALVGLLLGAAVVLLPFVWMVSLSLKPADEIFTRGVDLLPSRLEWQNYVDAFTQVDLARYLMNGVIVCGGILVFQTLFAVPCAFALAHRRFVGRQVIFGLVLAGLLVPFHVTAIPIFLGLAELRLINTYTALIAPFVASVFGIFLFRQFMARLPADLFDAARVDGLSETAIVWRIAFPLAMPAATAFAVFSVTAHWNDLFWPLIVVTDPDLATPPRGIVFFRDAEAGDNVGPLMAAAVIVTAPLIAGFLLAQRTFTRGIAAGGLRG
ncbi:carbohydrate ABC transporter permease [Rhodospira trueperi]|uniref:Multiple sugar transport system permease protein n=1 Tax=Rhodospira trueperi TaxID=69960 RepID=A0A1G7ARF6_9PROT|nr:carbohydrate ABC transporter permease [Rhodospira trueperi]SDE16585.1 multiple sugar transport system permease protein [Rhodospira trueperi]